MPTRTPKQRNHNEWFRRLSTARKSCPNCKARIQPNESIWSWGEYLYAKWRTVTHFCKDCWPSIKDQLNSHTGDCGCKVTLQIKDSDPPAWMHL